MVSVPGDLVSDDPGATELLYQPMVLENALNRALGHYREDHEEPLATPMDSLPSLLQMFRCFVNKLALVCDSNRGGKTVTAIAILQGRDCAVYVLASNSRAVSEQKEVEEFLTKILHFTHQNPHELERKALTKKVLWHMILFNRDRVKAYLKNLPRYLHECIADCQRREQSKLGIFPGNPSNTRYTADRISQFRSCRESSVCSLRKQGLRTRRTLTTNGRSVRPALVHLAKHSYLHILQSLVTVNHF